MEFKKSPVRFDEEAHRYFLGDKELRGITGLIHQILGLGVYPDASGFTKGYLIPRAGSRGTAVHHAIQTFDELGICQTHQIVTTTYYKGESNEYVTDEEWDVDFELDSYRRHLENGGFKALANELTVSDETNWASQIDNVWLNKKTAGIWLVDTKTNNIKLYPLCGYFNPNYFTSGEDALKEYLSWQLSIYAELFELNHAPLKVEGLACNWLRKDDSEFWIIERKPSELVWELLKTEHIITDNGPVYFHHDPSVFGISKQTETLPANVAETLPDVGQDVVDYVTALILEEKNLKAKMEEAKKGLRMAMEKHGVKSFDFGKFKATISADSKRTNFDTTRFEKEHPELYKEYTTKKTTKGGFTLKAKES